MWIILGLLGFYILYRLIFRWYLVTLLKMGHNPFLAPALLRYPFFNFGLYALAFCIFCFATYSFYRAAPWMVLLSPALLFVAMMVHAARQTSTRDDAIAVAVRTQILMQKQGATREQISDAISIAALGEGSGLAVDPDWELKQLLKSYILPTLGVFTTLSALTSDGEHLPSTVERYQKDSAEIDALIDREYERPSSTRRTRN
jgi:hypothetical protein